MRITGTQRILGLISAWMAAAVFGILFNVFIQAKEAPEIVIQKGHSDGIGGITSVAISRDGKYIASGGEENIVRLWEVATGKQIYTFQGYMEGFICLFRNPTKPMATLKKLQIINGQKLSETIEGI